MRCTGNLSCCEQWKGTVIFKENTVVLTVDVEFVGFLKDGGGQQRILDPTGVHDAMITGLSHDPQGGHSLVGQSNLLKMPQGHVRR